MAKQPAGHIANSNLNQGKETGSKTNDSTPTTKSPQAAHSPQHSTSSGASANPPDAIVSIPTLGTITRPHSVQEPHVSPFAQNQVASTAPQAPLTPVRPAPPRPTDSISSINTGTTPLSTTPGGSSTPIKISMSSLTAAASASNSPAILMPQTPGRTYTRESGQSALTTGSQGLQVVDQPQQQQQSDQTKQEQQQQQQQQQEQQGKQFSNLTPFKSTKRTGSALASWKHTKTIVRIQADRANWAYYLFLAIFVGVLIILIIVLIVTRLKK